jgi:hypothetical protein
MKHFSALERACLLRMYEADNANPNSLGGITIFPLCMRAAGWVRVRKAP